jgi:hypothetical protein
MKRDRGDVVPDSREDQSGSSKSSAMQKAGNKRALNAAPDSAAAGASKRVRQGPDPMKEFSVLLTREFVQVQCCLSDCSNNNFARFFSEVDADSMHAEMLHEVHYYYTASTRLLLT